MQAFFCSHCAPFRFSLKIVAFSMGFSQKIMRGFSYGFQNPKPIRSPQAKENRNHFRFTASLRESRNIISVYHLTTSSGKCILFFFVYKEKSHYCSLLSRALCCTATGQYSNEAKIPPSPIGILHFFPNILSVPLNKDKISPD